jgi:hypothetical protein
MADSPPPKCDLKWFSHKIIKGLKGVTFSLRNEYMLAALLMMAISNSGAQSAPKPKIHFNPIVVNKDFKGDLKLIRILSAKIENNILKLEVAHCKKSDLKKFCLVTSGMYEESFPPGISLFLAGQPDESCEKKLNGIVNFDLKSLQYKGSKQLRIKLEGYQEPIIYKYNQ